MWTVSLVTDADLFWLYGQGSVMNLDFNYLPWDGSKQEHHITPCMLPLVYSSQIQFESFHIMRMPFLSILVLCAYPYGGGNWSVALIQLYQYLLSIRLSFRVMSLSAVFGIRDLGEGSIGNVWLIVLTLKLRADLQCFLKTIKISSCRFGFPLALVFLLFIVTVKWLKAALLFDHQG